eukprot:1733517-Heterocapsa_arctica.AAC.1
MGPRSCKRAEPVGPGPVPEPVGAATASSEPGLGATEQPAGAWKGQRRQKQPEVFHPGFPLQQFHRAHNQRAQQARRGFTVSIKVWTKSPGRPHQCSPFERVHNKRDEPEDAQTAQSHCE